MFRFPLVVIVVSIIVTSAAANEITQFRGSDGNGIITGTTAPLTFSEDENISWKKDLPGKGWSSPVIADGKIWLTTAIADVPDDEEREALLTKAGDDPKIFKVRQIAKSIQLTLVEVDLDSGEILQTRELVTVNDPDPIHKTNSYASPTPVIDEGNIYCHFGTYGTFCLNRSDLSTVWQKTIPLEHGVGPGSSPFVYKDLLVLICDGIDRQFVTALDKSTGQTLWETERPEMDAPDGDQKKSYDTPVAVTDQNGREQLICMGSQWVVSYDPQTGNELWKVRHGKGFSVVPRPVVEDDILYISTGFGKAQLWAIKIDGEGDVTDSHVLWTNTRNIPTKPSPLLVDEKLFLINDTGIASCFDAKSGELLWTERVGGNYSASPTYIDGKIYFASESGVVTVIAAESEYRELAENQLAGQIMASPIAVNGALFIRTDKALYKIKGNQSSEEATRKVSDRN